MGFELILIPPFLKPITLDLIVQERENVREFDRAPRVPHLKLYRCTSGVPSS
jgi:hypothetical protein